MVHKYQNVTKNTSMICMLNRSQPSGYELLVNVLIIVS